MKKIYTTIFVILLFSTIQAQTVDFSITYIGTNSITGNYQMALLATPSSTITDANTDDMVAGFYVPTGVTLGNFEIGNSGIPPTDWTSYALGSNANGDGFYLARVEAGAMGTILNGDGPFQLILFDIIADPNPTSGNIIFIENGDPIFDPFFLENYMNVNGGNNIYIQNDPAANSVSFETLSVSNDVSLETLGITIYPNPTKNNIYINFKHQGDYSFSVYNMSGKEIFQQVNLQVNNTFNLSKYTSGIYILKLKDKTNNTIQNVKIVKM